MKRIVTVLTCVMVLGLATQLAQGQAPAPNHYLYLPAVLEPIADTATPTSTARPTATSTATPVVTSPAAPTSTSSTTPLATPTRPSTVTLISTSTPWPTATPTFIPSSEPSRSPTTTATPTTLATSRATATAMPTSSPTATRLPPPSGDNVVCSIGAPDVELCAWVSDALPASGSKVTVYGRLVVAGLPQAGLLMQTSWHYKTVTRTQECTTNDAGIAGCERDTGSATAGYQVNVDVTIAGQTVTTAFTPQ